MQRIIKDEFKMITEINTNPMKLRKYYKSQKDLYKCQTPQWGITLGIFTFYNVSFESQLSEIKSK